MLLIGCCDRRSCRAHEIGRSRAVSEPRLASQAIAIQKTCQFATSCVFSSCMRAVARIRRATRCLKPRAERRASEAVKSGAAKGCGVASRSQAPKAAWMLILESSHRKPGPQGYMLLEDTSRSTQLMLGLPAWSSHFLTEPRKQGRVAGHSAMTNSIRGPSPACKMRDMRASIRAKPSMSVTWEVLPRACTCQTLVVPRCFYTLACSLLSLLQPDTVFSLIYMLKGWLGCQSCLAC